MIGRLRLIYLDKKPCISQADVSFVDEKTQNFTHQSGEEPIFFITICTVICGTDQLSGYEKATTYLTPTSTVYCYVSNAPTTNVLK